jgi:cytochrome c553
VTYIGARIIISLVGTALVGLCLAGAGSGQSVSEPERFPRALSDETLKRQISGYANDLCGECHDRPTGREAVPRIAGQQPAYLIAQLDAFRRSSRAEPEAYDCMWGLSAALSEDLVTALAGYFASKPPLPGISGNPAATQAGQELFKRREGEAVPSCAQCHGEDAGGKEATPRLAGQVGAYLNRQMHAIRLKLRTSTVMHGAIKDLTDEDMYSLAVYLQSL